MEKRKELFDVLLQEVSFGPSLKIIKYLKENYAYFCTRIGPNPLKMESCLFFGSKYLPVSPPFFIEFRSKTPSLKNGVFCFEAPSFWILSAHLIAGSSEKHLVVRNLQLNTLLEIKKKLQKRNKKPVFVIGDLNLNRMDHKEKKPLKALLQTFYDLCPAKAHDEQSFSYITCTNYLNAWIRGKAASSEFLEESIDYALIDKESLADFQKLSTTILPLYNHEKPNEAISDHHAIVLNASLK